MAEDNSPGNEPKLDEKRPNADRKKDARGKTPDGNGPKKPTSFPEWDQEKLEALNNEQLKNLKDNAERIGVQELVERCLTVMAERKAKAPVKRAPVQSYEDLSPAKKALYDANKKLTEFAEELLKEFDFSIETAKKLSAGTQRFAAHSLLGKNHKPKVGGGKKTAQVETDIYISWRLKDQAFALVLLRYSAEEPLIYEVLAPKQYLSHPMTLTEARPNQTDDKGLKFYEAAQHFQTFEEAAETYRNIIAQVAPRRS